MGQEQSFTKLEAGEKADKLSPLYIGYYQVGFCYFQFISLNDISAPFRTNTIKVWSILADLNLTLLRKTQQFLRKHYI